jgi:hypothetical protein
MKTAIELLKQADWKIGTVVVHDSGSAKRRKEAETLVRQAVGKLEGRPKWETPEQYEKRTGKKWPDDWAVYALYEDNGGSLKWFAQSRGFTEKQIKRNKSGSGIKMMVCATEAGPPPDEWGMEE